MFATIEQVASLTGRAVTEPSLRQADAIIKMASGRADATRLRSRDRYLLRLATAYQTAYMNEHPEVFTNLDVASHSQLDVSVTFRDGDGSGETTFLAPLARQCLRRLSWKRSRSVTVDSDFVQGRGTTDSHPGINWVPIED